ncbi:hypothetical protein L2E82_12253 [Cichorium intybus]|uniref:Uncharacterized protein n=1 Tax=Cichorium intybus TaxID=13427 RepID=A0ACB9GGT5_CICIN|nr:hypothetical protein L2E82_12253 [Cichorium intybus]
MRESTEMELKVIIQMPLLARKNENRGDSSSRNYSLSFIAPLEEILFDIDGNLCDCDPLHYYAFHDMLQEIGFNDRSPIDEEFFINKITGKHNEELCRVLPIRMTESKNEGGHGGRGGGGGGRGYGRDRGGGGDFNRDPEVIFCVPCECSRCASIDNTPYSSVAMRLPNHGNGLCGSYGGVGSYNTGLYGNTMYEGGHGGLFGGSRGMYNNSFGGPMGGGNGIGPGYHYGGNQDPNNQFGSPSSPPRF